VNEFLLIEDCNEWGKNLADFIAIGNAVHEGQGGFWRTPAGTPFTSDLSRQDFLTLLQTGHTLVALVMGNCVYHVADRGMITAMSQAYHNVEFPNFYPSPYTARELAIDVCVRRCGSRADHREKRSYLGTPCN
jgi:hypothetical protein